MIVWLCILLPSAAVGIICSRFSVTWRGSMLAGAIPWTGLLVALLFGEYCLPYRGGGASMWPIAQLFGGTVAAGTGIMFHRLGLCLFRGGSES